MISELRNEESGPPTAKLRLLIATLLIVGLCVLVLYCPVELASAVVRYTGYYFVLAAGLVFAVCQIRIWRRAGRGRWLGKGLVPAVAATLLGTWLLFAQAEPGFKIAMDDYILASTARNLHESREVVATLQVVPGAVDAEPQVFVDKRPWLYPLLVSLVHDLTGYRAINSVALNMLIAVAFLFLAFRLGRRIGGGYGGVLSVLLWVSLPLLAQTATGGGLELLGLFLTQLVFLLALQYIGEPNRLSEGALVLGGVLLAYTRYEAGLFLLPVLLVVALGWWRRRRCLISAASLGGAVFLVPLLLHMKVYLQSPDSWELTGSADSAFALSHLAANFPHALSFFFDAGDELANSLLLSVFGLASLICLLVSGWRMVLPRSDFRDFALVFACMLPFLVAQLLLVTGFHAGRLDSPFVSRYALVFHFSLVLAAVVALDFCRRRFSVLREISLGLVLLFILGYTLPTNAKAVFSKRNFAVNEQAWLETLSASELVAGSLVLDRFSVPWMLRDWAACSPSLVWTGPEGWLEARGSNVYYVERLAYRDGSFRPLSEVGSRLRGQFDLQMVAERSFRPFTLRRVYRLVLPQ